MTLPLRVLSVAVLGALCACAPRLTPPVTATSDRAEVAMPPPLEAPIRLTLVGTNDMHGWVAGRSATLADGSSLDEGGLAIFGGYLSVLRAENPGGVLLLDAGDIFQGTLLSNITEGEVVIAAMNQLGYTAAALGNHEFDYGPVGPAPVAVEPGSDPFGALKARIRQARFPVLAANIYEASTGLRPGWLGNDGTAIVVVNGVKVGLLGLITPTTPQVTNPVNVVTLRFGNLVPEAERAAKSLRERGAEVVVALAHAGGKCESYVSATDLTPCDSSQEVFDLLLNLPVGTLDAVIAGHTHAVLGHVVNGTPVIETGGMGKSFGLLELSLDPKTRKVLPARTVLQPAIAICEQVEASLGSCDLKKAKAVPAPTLQPVTFRGQPVVRDRGVDEAIAPALAQLEAVQQRPLGFENPAFLGRRYEAESGLGSLLADALREYERADVALLNSGGLRADLRAGPVRYGDFYEVIPFDNTISTLTVTGTELERLLLAAYGARKGVFQISGLKITLKKCPGEGRLKSVTLPDGRPLSAEKRYRVVMPDFLARGGDGLAAVVASLPPGRIDYGESRPDNFRDALVAQLQKKGRPLQPPPEGRIQFVSDDRACRAGAAVDLHATH